MGWWGLLALGHDKVGLSMGNMWITGQSGAGGEFEMAEVIHKAQ